ncbi:MAG: hypothetical protein ACJA0T_002588 [Colwellia sp.]|jgi:hypothetical protein
MVFIACLGIKLDKIKKRSSLQEFLGKELQNIIHLKQRLQAMPVLLLAK